MYSLGSEQLNMGHVLVQIITIVWALLPILQVCFIWGRMPAAAHSIVESIRYLSTTGLSQTFLIQIQLFVSICSSTKMGINVFGFFTIDSQTGVMILGTIATYGIVVIQFQQEKSNDCHYNVSQIL
ncbi:uncharacterized protein LOC106077197 [Biomphalaria glabrata]|uniref:Uncharacterized protein LOC106077197 n=1 Tax=Biomphalaria glabrata TaxID=6526 RepID=A0A9W3AJP9_BIOGL|nr:uncharacterized protein LOC106077197 [Biomphalaria glabrata]